ncbi:glutamate receptor ionotropic, kainate 5 [Trichonephila clavata]|uniref:Glutamate receptor ionotropic, kainate 5 n=1 Tax=Trichonephila clavata TaxID=2740835 RepID=A0A8X6K8L8_TRICU|nr:glutamate receptor ionotropic, kainate 5 [Trichonephila clavata]
MKFPSKVKIAVTSIKGVCDVIQDSQGRVIIADGIEAEFLQILSTVLNFKYELLLPEDKQWGRQLPDGNWTGMIGLVQHKKADLGMCSTVMTPDRQEAVDFSYPYEVTNVVFATKLPGLLPKFLSYLYPFSPGVWFATIGLAFLVPYLWRYILKIKFSFRQLFSGVFHTLLSGAMTIGPSGPSDYFLLGTWIFGVSFLSRSYTAVLLSFLTLSLKDTVLRDAPALSKAISHGTYRCYTFRGAWITHALEASGKETTRLIGKAMDDNDWFIIPSIEGVGNLLDEGNTAVIAMKPFFADHFADTAAISEDYFFITQLALTVRKNFCCKKYLNRKINAIIASGLYEKCSNHYNFRARLKLRQNQMKAFDNINPLSVQDLSGAFLLLSLGLSMSFIAFILEVLRIRMLK